MNPSRAFSQINEVVHCGIEIIVLARVFALLDEFAHLVKALVLLRFDDAILIFRFRIINNLE